MKRLFCFLALALVCVGNVLAWEPVIKETHWFGMREFYESPIPAAPIDKYFVNADFSKTNGWTSTTSGDTYTIGNGRIGKVDEIVDNQPTDTRYSITVGYNGVERTLYPTRDDVTHTMYTWCFGFSARWSDRSCSYQQTTTKKLLAGTYELTFDVENANSANTTPATYNSLFYVKVGNDNPIYSNNTEWMTQNNGGWRTHRIRFTVDGTQDVTISFGYGTGNNNYSALATPVLFVSNLNLETVSAGYDPRITWSDDYIESITVVKEWTGQRPLQQPKTSYYSWLNHELRFSVEDKNGWWLSRDDNGDHYSYDGLGLCNNTEGYKKFYIHGLKQGDKFNIEYYRYNKTEPNPILLSNNVSDLGVNASVYGTDSDGKLVYYTMSSDGDVCINIPSKAIIRAVRIEHKNYQKATYRVDELTTDELQALAGHTETKGYRCTMTGAGVLEDKRGAVPYITMRYGAENDMTFVRKLENGEYGAACIVDESNDFNPDKLQAYFKNMGLTADQAKDRLAGKEWTVFTCEKDNNGDIFKTIFPMYGSYYYFFPEVNGILKVRFYCEGNEESPAFWFKQKEQADGTISIIDRFPNPSMTGMNNNGRTSGGNFYELTVEVERGGTYYLCSNPTIVQHEMPIIRVVSYEFVPTFYVKPLWKAVPNGTTTVGDGSNGNTYAAEIGHGVFRDIEGTISGQMKINGVNQDKVQCWGNVASAEAYVQTVSNKQYLGFRNITFKTTKGKEDNQGGAIVAHLNGAAGHATFVLTIAYDAEDKNNDGTPKEVQVKKWDFYTDGLSLGQYKNKNSILYSEVHKADGLTADWVNTHLDLLGESGDGTNPREPIFKSVYDMEGDNADMLHETAGLLIFSDANKLAIYNEDFTSSNKTKFEDSYIGLMSGSKLCIPYLKDGDRIVIKMGRSEIENGVSLTVDGAKDAIGNEITSDYKISGSYANDDKWEEKKFPHVEYHFIKDGDGGDGTVGANDFCITVNDDTKMVKIYTIEIYRSVKNDNADIITENALKGDLQKNKRYILNTTQDATNDNAVLHLIYSGQNELVKYEDHVGKTGNLEYDNISVSSDHDDETNDYWYTYTAAKGKFGVFKARLGVKTTNDTYVTDYADCMVPVGYLEKMNYPYTWDFTDLKKYVGAGIDEDGTEKEVADDDADLRIWNEWDFSVRSEKYDNYIFAPGGQLYGGKTMFDESRGIGIIHNDKGMTMNGSGYGAEAAEDGGLEASDEYGFVVPQVAAGNAVYVHATPKSGATAPQFTIGTGDKQALTKVGNEVFAMKMADDADKANVTLYLKGYEVHKIAVSTDPKSVNSYGYSTECRAHDIDHRLTPYFSAGNIKAYRVSDVNYDESKIVLAEVDKILPAASANGEEGLGVILYNTKAGEDKSSDFHLFVPDMHDKDNNDLKLSAESNKLYANLTQNSSIGANPGEYANYLLNAKGKSPVTGLEVTGIAFYRASKTATLGANKAYLPILTSAVKSSTGNLGGAKMHIVFVDEDEEDNETTGIAVVNAKRGEDDTFYTLSGVKVERPTESGIYIKNGKKVIIK